MMARPKIGATASDASSATDTAIVMRQVRSLLFAVALALIAWLLYTLANVPALAPSTDVGYYIGVVGASLMLLLMTYPIYKRFRAFRSWGKTRFWFRLHMICGLLGPAFIIVHSGLNMRSMNAAWAFWSMVIVAGSGIMGRFLYRRIHRGMHGELETAQTLGQRLPRLHSTLTVQFLMTRRFHKRWASSRRGAQNWQKYLLLRRLERYFCRFGGGPCSGTYAAP